MASANISREDILRNLSSADIDCTVRNNAIMAAGEFCDPEIIAAVEKLCTAPDPATRYFAKKTLKKIKDSMQKSETDPAAAPIVQAAGLDAIKSLLASQNSENRQRAMKALTANFNAAFLPQLVEMLKTEKDPFVIASLVKLVGKHGGAAHVDALSVFLGHEDPRVRANTIEALELSGSEKIIAHIVPFINDVDNRIKANAVKALSKFKSDEMLEVLGSMIKSDQLWMRDSAIFALQQIAGDQAVDLLCVLAQDPEKTIANNAMQALIRIGSVYALKKVDELRLLQKEKSSAPSIKKIFSGSESAQVSEPQPPGSDAYRGEPPSAEEPKNENFERTSVRTPVEPLAPQKGPPAPAPQQQTARAGRNEGAFEKLKANIDKKETSLINIVKDEDSAIMSNFKIDLDDNFTGYAPDIAYVAIAVAAAEKKKAAPEKSEQEEESLPGMTLKSANPENAARMQNEAKKKMLLDSLRGAKPKK